MVQCTVTTLVSFMKFFNTSNERSNPPCQIFVTLLMLYKARAHDSIDCQKDYHIKFKEIALYNLFIMNHISGSLVGTMKVWG